MRTERIKSKQGVVEVSIPESIEEARNLWGDAHLLALAVIEYRRAVKTARRPDHKALIGKFANVDKEHLIFLLNKLKEQA